MKRTRFAPSPTGYIHVGNLRTALYSYLLSKHSGGQFILRIEDTDQVRSDKKFESYIFKALKDLGIKYDEGPDVGGDYGPYRQSERFESGMYLDYAKKLVELGHAYYCFCPEAKSDLDTYKEECNYSTGIGYNKHCRNLTKEQVAEKLAKGEKYVIRQKIPANQTIVYYDKVYGKLEFDSNQLDDQVLIKSDLYPTYNFANVIDDHLMEITDIVRGNEYLTSTPKYVLLYQSFGWDVPNFIHLPIINIIDENGEEKKLSKRFSCSSFDNLIQDGYLKEAIINYIMFLGWNPKTTEEFFNIDQLIAKFNVKHLNNSSSVLFDQKKLDWYNQNYIRKMSKEQFKEHCIAVTDYDSNFNWDKVIPMLKGNITTLTQIKAHTEYIFNPKEYDKELLYQYRTNITDDQIVSFLNNMINHIDQSFVTSNDYYTFIKQNSVDKEQFGINMHIFRVAMSGLKDVIITGVDIAEMIGIDAVKERLKVCLQKFQ